MSLSPNPRRSFLWLVFVLAIVSLVYSPTLENQYINWDDDAQIVSNPFLQNFSLGDMRDIFSTTANYVYVPLTSLSHAVELHFFGDNPFVPHLNNLVLHLFVVGFIFIFVQMLNFSVGTSVMAALVFGIHPMHVESVAWLTERKDVLYSFFYMLAAIFYLRFLRALADSENSSAREAKSRQGNIYNRKTVPWLVLVFVCGILSALSKPMALSLPFILLLLDWYQRRKVSFWALLEKIWLGALLFPIIWISYANFSRVVEFSLIKSSLIWLWCFAFYIQKFFLPLKFHLFYWLPAPVSLLNVSYALAVGISGVVITGLWWFRKSRIYLFSVGWYFCSVFFLLRYDCLRDLDMVADRFMYLPSLGFCLLVGHGFSRLLARDHPKFRRIVVMCLGALLFFYLSAATFRQIFVWRDSRSFWGHQIQQHERNPNTLIKGLCFDKYGEALMAEKEWQQLVDGYRSCVLASGAGQASCLSVELVLKRDELLKYFSQASAFWPKYGQPYYHSGKVFEALREPARAQAYFEKAAALDSKNYGAFWSLGKIYHEQQKYSQVVASFNRALELSPGNQLLLKDVLRFYAENTAGCLCADLYNEEQKRLVVQSRL